MLYSQPRGGAVQRNAADPKQAKNAERIERRRQARLAGAMKTVMGTPEGRLVLWEIMRTCGIYRSVWDPSARIHYNAGRQDVGHELLGDLHAVDTDLYLLMEREMRALQAREQAEIDGLHTPSAREKADGDD